MSGEENSSVDHRFLMGPGVEVPMLVILIGAIGGAITQGVVGLFIGSVVLALGYQLLFSWITPDDNIIADPDS